MSVDEQHEQLLGFLGVAAPTAVKKRPMSDPSCESDGVTNRRPIAAASESRRCKVVLVATILLLFASCATTPGTKIDNPKRVIRTQAMPDVLCQVVVQRQIVDTVEGTQYLLLSSRGESLKATPEEWVATVLGEPKCSDEWKKLQ